MPCTYLSPAPQRTSLEQLEIIQLVPVLHNIPLNLAPDGPRDKVLRRPRDQVRRVRDRLGADAHVALLDQLRRGLHRLRHTQPRHDDGEPPPRKGTDGRAVLHRRQLRRRRQDAHVVQLVQEEVLVLTPGGVVGRQEGEAMRELPDGLQYTSVVNT